MVADMLILHHAQALPPTEPDTTAILSPATAEELPRPQPGSAGDAAAFIGAMVAEVADFAEGLGRR
ncbi:hypothetical protein [Streptomyces sp. NPDC006527]|uniref:hypothetical protein n=1 Tax=Streptomyces sp. NPDC006527 TaxID=3364749 RepID=UPI0036C33FE5